MDDLRPTNFEAVLQEQDGVGVVVACGELDIASAPRLKGLLEEAIAQCATAGGVVADLSQVAFMESVTLGVLVEQRNQLRDAGKELALVIQGSEDETEEHPVGKLLGLTGQAGEFGLYVSRAAAVEDIAGKG